ncbi:MAG: hypothetical protein IMY72_07765 [Bacteroidetes bacterium]|nr:hypothetical protein [Bacteroidota bacterium]
MKKIIIFFGVILALGAKAQDNGYKSLFGNNFNVSGFGGPSMMLTNVSGEFAYMMGGGGAVLLNKTFFIGGYGYRLINRIEPNLNDVVFPQQIGGQYLQENSIDFDFGGIWTGIIIKGNKAIHPIVSCQFGWGNLSLNNDYANIDDPVFVINPIIEIEANITRFFRMSIGGNYRIVQDVNFGEYKNSDFSGAGLFFGFKFGWF